MTIVPRTGPFSASSAFATTSWDQRGKSVACGVRTGAFAIPWNLRFVARTQRYRAVPGHKTLKSGGRPGSFGRGEQSVGSGEGAGLEFGDAAGAGERRQPDAAEIRRAEFGGGEGEFGFGG